MSGFDLLRVNCMIDLETLSTKYNAGILSIGAVKFDHSGIKDEFYVNIRLKSIMEHGLRIDQDTLNWWNDQNPDAIKSLFSGGKSLRQALSEFKEWYGPTSMHTWSNGANFDQVIMCNAFDVFSEKEPWDYYHGMCFRTLRSLIDPKKTLAPKIEIAHNALHDAKAQAEHLIQMWHAWAQ